MSREQSLAQAFVELADVRNVEFDEIQFLNVLARHCVELAGWSAIAVLLADREGALQVAAKWPAVDELAALFDPPDKDDPCAGSFHARLPMRLDLGEEERSRIPFAARAGEAGFASIHAFPLRSHDEVVGSFGLFAADPADPSPADRDLAQALAEVATLTILHRRDLHRAESVVQQLQGALNSRVVIEQAKGVIAEHARLDMEGAFDVLRGHARKNRLRLAVIAKGVVEGKIRPESLLAGRAGSAVKSAGRAQPTVLPSGQNHRDRDRRS